MTTGFCGTSNVTIVPTATAVALAKYELCITCFPLVVMLGILWSMRNKLFFDSDNKKVAPGAAVEADNS